MSSPFEAEVTTRVETEHGPVRIVGEVHEHPCSYAPVMDACRRCDPTAIGIEVSRETLPQAAKQLRERTRIVQRRRDEWNGEQPLFGRTGVGAALEYATKHSKYVAFLDTSSAVSSEPSSEFMRLDVSEQLVVDGELQRSALRERLDSLRESCPEAMLTYVQQRDAHIAKRALGTAAATDGLVLLVVGGIHAITLPSVLDEVEAAGVGLYNPEVVFDTGGDGRG